MSLMKVESSSAMLRTVIAGLCFIIVGYAAALYPVTPMFLAAVLIAYGVVLWRWPSAWLIVLPAVIPAFDLTPWTGWLLVGEYQLFSLMTVGVLMLRAPPSANDVRLSGLSGAAIALAVTAYFSALAIGLFSPLPLPTASDLIYLEPINALRLVSGFAIGLLLFPFMRERQRSGCHVVSLLGAGMVLGLLLVATGVIVERMLFPGLLNVQEDYRVAGSFSSMHLGGGHIGAYLAFALPFLFVCLLRPRLAGYATLLLVTILSAYALIVTFARAAYAAALVSSGLALLGWLIASMRGRWQLRTSLMPLFVVAIVVGALGAAGLGTGYMSERFASVSPDFATRENNWEGGMVLRNDGILTDLFGTGLGTYPRAVVSRKKGTDVPGNFVIAREGGADALVMAVGAPYYFGQKVHVVPASLYHVSLDAWSSDPRATIGILLCEKWLLYSEACSGAHFKPKRQGDWEHLSATLSTANFSRAVLFGVLHRTVELALFDDRSPSNIHLRNVSLTDQAGTQLVTNGDFSRGLDRWFFTDDNHLVWRMKNQYLMILFEEGLLGIVAFLTLHVAAMLGGLRAIWRGDRMGAIIVGALAAFLFSSLFDYLLEAPRIAALYYLVCFAGLTMLDDRHDSRATPAAETQSTNRWR